MTPITLGLEEELQVVDAYAYSLCSHELEAGKALFPDHHGTTSGEAQRFILEVQTPVCADPDAVVASLRTLRAIASSRAAAQGQRVFSASLHPFARWQDVQARDQEGPGSHYSRVFAEYQDIARRMVSCGTHIHLGVADAALRLHVLNGLRTVLPALLALSASSPFFEGRDTGLESWRHSLLDQMPRMGIAEPWSSADAYWTHVKRLQETGCIARGFNLWGDIRLHHLYPTVEVRILDAMPRLSRTWLVTALLHLQATRLCAQAIDGRAEAYLPRELINENKWRVRRRGLDAQYVDWARDEELPVSDYLWQWVDDLAPFSAEMGWGDRLPAAMETALQEGTSSREQRSIFAAGGELPAVVQHLVNQTAQPWGEQ